MRTIIIFAACFIVLSSCKKQEEWLDVKSNRSDVTPKTLKDLQALLDYPDYMNDFHPGGPLLGSDCYYVSYNTWQAEVTYAKNAYVWKADDFYAGSVNANDWSSPYVCVEYCNIVLEGLQKIARTPENQAAWDNCKGSALFYRAFAFFNLATTYAKPFKAASADTDLGIPLRLSADVNERSVRASVKETYSRITDDLKDASALLPAAALYQTRPTTFAAHALLARVCLSMEDYANAGLYADKALSGPYKLIDFNSLSTTASYSMPVYPNHPEVIFYAKGSTSAFNTLNGIVDSTLYRSYASNDLRKTMLYSSVPAFKGSYTGSLSIFNGLAINEQYLIRAEAAARAGNIVAAMQDLNTLLGKRWRNNTFSPLTAANANAALDMVIAERRKELPFTGTLRWIDLRRLNNDGRYAITLTRILNNQVYTLPPNDARYVLPIPDIEIRLSGIEQNVR
ncbi:RagB/SusD family nutrient uptake outer membrane protein [Sediminibacterium roseum]|uniref:RagB/SusD family nutrient uptake outer membrane protein n=1 Tax=Sediminibacterium roseum TaxID=1978412 RepID=A0ABW9ZXV1_9BACT|nr:RagB/SusD family nutrient uptake outer membrane protein [Sediminibacterium roseum]NCI49686.1 RagB/SusD family nutrient uptake outer membrane protein [Sediminibacterium roseum]